MEGNTKSKSVLIPMTDGFEETEAVSIIDILRRADLDVTLATINGKENQSLIVNGSHGIQLIADTYFEDIVDIEYDMIACPGGIPGAKNLGDYQPLIEKLKKQKEQDKHYAAICAAPNLVFEQHGLLKGEVATANPGFMEEIKDKSRIEDRVVVSNKCITSRSVGTAAEFAITLVEQLVCPEKAAKLAKIMLIRR